MPDSTKHRAHLLFEAAQSLGWSDPAEVAKFARRLSRGLPAEDELSVIFHWLGRCKLVHKLDQFPYPPDVGKHFRVPDLLAVFDVAGASVPVLVEVKKAAKKLSWTPEYLETLQAYAALLGLPLLVAWKHQSFWTLFEARHLRKAIKNFTISFPDAMRENLLGLLAGDFSFSFRPGVGLHIKMRKLTEETEDGLDFRIEDASFLNDKGEKLDGRLWQWFRCISEDESQIQEDETHITQSFVVPKGTRQAEFAHRALVTLLRSPGASSSSNWRQIMGRKLLPLMSPSPQQAARYALDAGFLQRVWHIYPKTRPDFIE